MYMVSNCKPASNCEHPNFHQELFTKWPSLVVLCCGPYLMIVSLLLLFVTVSCLVSVGGRLNYDSTIRTDPSFHGLQTTNLVPPRRAQPRGDLLTLSISHNR
ncbi:hypothetical protein CBL_13947 [Carabus blaptoides fortunei]